MTSAISTSAFRASQLRIHLKRTNPVTIAVAGLGLGQISQVRIQLLTWQQPRLSETLRLSVPLVAWDS